jgi:fatty-acyl-CoA synthase
MTGGRVRHTADELASAVDCIRAGFLRPMPPRVLVAGSRGIRGYGALGGLVVLAGARFPDRPAVVDERGSVTFAELDAHSNAVANA